MKVFIKVLVAVFILFSLALGGLYLKAAIDYHNRPSMEVIYEGDEGITIDLGVE
jgi:hypothetical protein